MTDQNFILPFQLESSALRGRIVRLDSVVNDILAAHNYPDAVSAQLAQTIALTAMLSSMLKYDGIFTLQAQGKGALSMLVSDMTSAGIIRGCATFDAAELPSGQAALRDLMDEGYLAFTVDQGGDTDRYQGIVELKDTLEGSIQNYFAQSEQIQTGIVMAAARVDGTWRAQGMMIQHMPPEGGKPLGNMEEDDWRRAMVLMQSCKREELLDPALSAQDLLFRLFHEEGVRVYDPQAVQKGCRCSEEKIAAMLKMMSDEDIRDMQVDGSIAMTCEFCSREYRFNPADLAAKLPN